MKTITISVLINVALSVDAYKDENGDTHIDTVRGYVGLPSAQEIYEAMEPDDFDNMSIAFDEA